MAYGIDIDANSSILFNFLRIIYIWFNGSSLNRDSGNMTHIWDEGLLKTPELKIKWVNPHNKSDLPSAITMGYHLPYYFNRLYKHPKTR